MRNKGLVCLTIAIGLFCASGAALASIPSSDLPIQTQEALEESVKKWIGEQAGESKNQYGKKNKRGYFSRDFKKEDEETFAATVHIETGGEVSKKTERFLLTLKKNGKGYDVVGDELQDTYVGLHRETHSRCYPFDKFDFDREGIDLRATNGTVCLDFYQGRVVNFRVHGEGMTYKYAPPEYAQALHINRDFHSVFEGLKKDHTRELEFDPAAFLVDCDPDSCLELLEEHFTGLTRAENDGADSTGTFEATPGDRALVEYNQRMRRENPFAHFRRPSQPGNKRWSVYVSRDVSPFTYPGAEEGFADIGGFLPGAGVHLTYDNWGGFEVTFNVYPRRLDIPEQLLFRIYGYYTEETLKNTDPYTLERREDEAARWHQVYSVKGNVDMGLEDPEMLEADIEFGIELKQPLREIPFFIQSIPQQDFSGSNRPRTLHVNSVQLDGEELTWTRTSQLGGLIILPVEMPAGTKLNIRMNFATRAMYKVSAMFTYVSRFGWMPFVRFGDFIDEFEMTIRTPVGYKVLGIGHKTDQREEDDAVVTHWKAESAVVFPSIAFGRYAEDGPGKKYRLPTKADGTPIPVTVHVDKASFEDWGITPGSLRPIAQQAVNAINVYQEISGVDYPYGELNFVNDPLGFLYGQAPSSLIYLGSGVFRGEGALAPYFTNSAGIAKFLKSVTAHEVGHQWWGSRVSNANERNYWFVESLAEFFSAVYLEAYYGQNEYQDQVDEWRRTIVDRRLRSNVQASYSVWGGEDGFGSYQANIYNKGPYAFHMLREIFKGEGPPGPEGADKKFYDFLKKFSQELAEKREIVTIDIQRAAEKALGGVDPEGNPYNVDLEWFFDQWIRGIGIPQYKMTYDVRQTEDGSWLVEGLIEQRVVMGSGRSHSVLDGKYYRGVVDLTVLAGGEEYEARRIVEGPQTPFKLKVPDKPVEVSLNKDGETLALDTIVNKSWD